MIIAPGKINLTHNSGTKDLNYLKSLVRLENATMDDLTISKDSIDTSIEGSVKVNYSVTNSKGSDAVTIEFIVGPDECTVDIGDGWTACDFEYGYIENQSIKKISNNEVVFNDQDGNITNLFNTDEVVVLGFSKSGRQKYLNIVNAEVRKSIKSMLYNVYGVGQPADAPCDVDVNPYSLNETKIIVRLPDRYKQYKVSGVLPIGGDTLFNTNKSVIESNSINSILKSNGAIKLLSDSSSFHFNFYDIDNNDNDLVLYNFNPSTHFNRVFINSDTFINGHKPIDLDYKIYNSIIKIINSFNRSVAQENSKLSYNDIVHYSHMKEALRSCNINLYNYPISFESVFNNAIFNKLGYDFTEKIRKHHLLENNTEFRGKNKTFKKDTKPYEIWSNVLKDVLVDDDLKLDNLNQIYGNNFSNSIFLYLPNINITNPPNIRSYIENSTYSYFTINDLSSNLFLKNIDMSVVDYNNDELKNINIINTRNENPLNKTTSSDIFSKTNFEDYFRDLFTNFKVFDFKKEMGASGNTIILNLNEPIKKINNQQNYNAFYYEGIANIYLNEKSIRNLFEKTPNNLNSLDSYIFKYLSMNKEYFDYIERNNINPLIQNVFLRRDFSSVNFDENPKELFATCHISNFQDYVNRFKNLNKKEIILPDCNFENYYNGVYPYSKNIDLKGFGKVNLNYFINYNDFKFTFDNNLRKLSVYSDKILKNINLKDTLLEDLYIDNLSDDKYIFIDLPNSFREMKKLRINEYVNKNKEYNIIVRTESGLNVNNLRSERRVLINGNVYNIMVDPIFIKVKHLDVITGNEISPEDSKVITNPSLEVLGKEIKGYEVVENNRVQITKNHNNKTILVKYRPITKTGRYTFNVDVKGESREYIKNSLVGTINLSVTNQDRPLENGRIELSFPSEINLGRVTVPYSNDYTTKIDSINNKFIITYKNTLTPGTNKGFDFSFQAKTGTTKSETPFLVKATLYDKYNTKHQEKDLIYSVYYKEPKMLIDTSKTNYIYETEKNKYTKLANKYYLTNVPYATLKIGTSYPPSERSYESVSYRVPLPTYYDGISRINKKALFDQTINPDWKLSSDRNSVILNKNLSDNTILDSENYLKLKFPGLETNTNVDINFIGNAYPIQKEKGEREPTFELRDTISAKFIWTKVPTGNLLSKYVSFDGAKRYNEMINHQKEREKTIDWKLRIKRNETPLSHFIIEDVILDNTGIKKQDYVAIDFTKTDINFAKGAIVELYQGSKITKLTNNNNEIMSLDGFSDIDKIRIYNNNFTLEKDKRITEDLLVVIKTKLKNPKITQRDLTILTNEFNLITTNNNGTQSVHTDVDRLTIVSNREKIYVDIENSAKDKDTFKKGDIIDYKVNIKSETPILTDLSNVELTIDIPRELRLKEIVVPAEIKKLKGFKMDRDRLNPNKLIIKVDKVEDFKTISKEILVKTELIKSFISNNRLIVNAYLYESTPEIEKANVVMYNGKPNSKDTETLTTLNVYGLNGEMLVKEGTLSDTTNEFDTENTYNAKNTKLTYSYIIENNTEKTERNLIILNIFPQANDLNIVGYPELDKSKRGSEFDLLDNVTPRNLPSGYTLKWINKNGKLEIPNRVKAINWYNQNQNLLSNTFIKGTTKGFVLVPNNGKTLPPKTTINFFMEYTIDNHSQNIDKLLRNTFAFKTADLSDFIETNAITSIPTIKTGKLTFTKKAQDTNLPLRNVKFRLVDAKTNLTVQEGTTLANGTLTFNNLEAKDYRLIEVEAPQGYVAINPILIKKSQFIDSNNSTVNLGNILNSKFVDPRPDLANIKIYKTGPDYKPLANVVFKLKNNITKETFNAQTNSQGILEKLVPVGIYTAEEISKIGALKKAPDFTIYTPTNTGVKTQEDFLNKKAISTPTTINLESKYMNYKPSSLTNYYSTLESFNHVKNEIAELTIIPIEMTEENYNKLNGDINNARYSLGNKFSYYINFDERGNPQKVYINGSYKRVFGDNDIIISSYDEGETHTGNNESVILSLTRDFNIKATSAMSEKIVTDGEYLFPYLKKPRSTEVYIRKHTTADRDEFLGDIQFEIYRTLEDAERFSNKVATTFLTNNRAAFFKFFKTGHNDSINEDGVFFVRESQFGRNHLPDKSIKTIEVDKYKGNSITLDFTNKRVDVTAHLYELIGENLTSLERDRLLSKDNNLKVVKVGELFNILKPIKNAKIDVEGNSNTNRKNKFLLTDKNGKAIIKKTNSSEPSFIFATRQLGKGLVYNDVGASLDLDNNQNTSIGLSENYEYISPKKQIVNVESYANNPKFDGTINFDFVVKKLKTNLIVSGFDFKTGNKLKGIKLVLIEENTDNIKECVTNEKGFCSFENLDPSKKYKIKQSEAPKGWFISEKYTTPQTVKLTPHSNNFLPIVNLKEIKENISLVIAKVDSDIAKEKGFVLNSDGTDFEYHGTGNESEEKLKIFMCDVTFELYDKETNEKIGNSVTLTKANLCLGKFEDLERKVYVLKETVTNNTHSLAKPIEIDLTDIDDSKLILLENGKGLIKPIFNHKNNTDLPDTGTVGVLGFLLLGTLVLGMGIMMSNNKKK